MLVYYTEDFEHFSDVKKKKSISKVVWKDVDGGDQGYNLEPSDLLKNTYCQVKAAMKLI